MSSLTPTADKVLKVALGQVGYREGRDKDGNWNNHQKYSPAVPGLEWSQGQAWCATFVSWVAMTAGAASLFPRTASTDAAASWYQQNKRWSQYPAIGAQGFLARGSDEFHTFLVVKYDDTYIWTVEGNTNTTGSPQGNGVYELRRRRRDTEVEGYGYPAYPEGIVSADPAWKSQRPKVDPRPAPKPVKLGLSWNMQSGRSSGRAGAALKAFIKANDRPVFIALQDARGYRAAISTVAALLGYKVYQSRDTKLKPKGVKVRSGGDTAILVRKGHKLFGGGVIHCAKTWHGPKGGLREGRYLQWVQIKISGTMITIVSVNMPTGGSASSAAWNETLSKIEKIVDTSVSAVAIGSWARLPKNMPGIKVGRIVHTSASKNFAVVKGHPNFAVTKGVKRGSSHALIRIVRK